MPDKFTPTEKLAEVEREISMRVQVYGRQVAANRMSQRQADRRLAIFEDIADDYRRLKENERLL